MTSPATTGDYVTRRWDLPGFRLEDSCYPPLHQMPAHADRCMRVSLLVAGAVEEVAEGVPHLCAPGSVVLKPGDVVHANRFGPAGARIISLVPNLDTLQAQMPARAGSGYRWRHGAPVALGGALHGMLCSTGAPRPERLRNCLAQFFALVGVGDLAAPRPPHWLEQGRVALHASIAEPPGVRALAARAGMHPVYFARVFRRCYGCTIREYVRRLRVLNAAALLAAGAQPLAQIALEAGFTDQAHFCHVFRRETGRTPHAYRLWHRQVAFVQSAMPRRK